MKTVATVSSATAVLALDAVLLHPTPSCISLSDIVGISFDLPRWVPPGSRCWLHFGLTTISHPACRISLWYQLQSATKVAADGIGNCLLQNILPLHGERSFQVCRVSWTSLRKTRHQNDIESRKCWSQMVKNIARTQEVIRIYIYIQYETYLIIDHHRYHLSDLATICQIPWR